MRRELDRLVAPLRRPENTRDDGRAMDPPEVAHDEGVAALGLVGRALGQAEVPGGVLLPGVLREIGVLGVGARLDLTPVAVEHVLAGLDEVSRVLDGRVVARVLGHGGGVWRVESRRPNVRRSPFGRPPGHDRLSRAQAVNLGAVS